MRFAFAIAWKESGPWLFTALPPEDTGELLSAVPGNAFLRLPYLTEFLTLWQKGSRLERYDTVFTWELRCALAVLLLRRLQRAKTPVVVVGPILKGSVLRILPLVRWLLADARRIVCFSSVERASYPALLRLPEERFVFLPTPWEDPPETPPATDAGFALALGHSNRDYGTLFRAVAGLEIPVTVVAANPSVFGGETPPANVTVRFNTDPSTTAALVATARLHLIPLHPVGFSAGQSVLLRAMAAGKACLVSAVPTIMDYVEPGETALLVPPHDPIALRIALTQLWDDTHERERLGTNAAHAVRTRFGFARFLADLLELC